MTYRVDVVGDSVAHVVSRAGGWIFDRSMQGWTVNVVGPTGRYSVVGDTGGRGQCPSGSPEPCATDVSGQLWRRGRRASLERRRLFKAQAMIAAHLTSIAGDREMLFARTTDAAESIELQSVTVIAPS